MTDDVQATCSNPDCRVAESGRCVEGFLELTACSHYGHDPTAEERSSTPEAADTDVTGSKLPGADTLTLDDASRLLRRAGGRVIAVIGPKGAGKTSLIASLYDLFQEGAIAGVEYARSETLHAFELACHEAIADLVLPRSDGLRPFLRRIGGDIPGGRSTFRSLCEFYRLTRKFESEPSALDAAIQLLDGELGGVPARAARVTVVAAAVRHAGQISETGFDYLLEHLNSIEPHVLDVSALELGRAVLHRRPSVFGGMLDSDGASRRLADDVLANTPEPELLAAMEVEPGLAGPLLRRQPQLAALPGVWSRKLQAEESGFEALRAQERCQPVVIAMIKAGRADLARRVTSEVGALQVLQSLTLAMDFEPSDRRDYENWLRVAAQPNAVAQMLSGAEGQPRRLLALLAQVMGPDEVPNDFGEDPWLSAVRRAQASTTNADETVLCAFLLSRSLGLKSRNQAALAQVAFEHTHAAAAADRLSDDSWRLLDPRLPGSMLWFDWDRCQRLRAGVVDLFVERQLAPEIFGRLVRDGSLFGLLADHAARRSAGRRYLKGVHRALMDAAEETYSERCRYIERLLR